MAETPSTMLPLGTKAYDFNLLDTRSGEMVSLQNLKSGTATIVMFICNHCPYVIHIMDELISVATEYQTKGMQFIAISSNDAKFYPADGPEKMREIAAMNAYPFPYLYDETQAVAKKYAAACTPDFYVFDGDLSCVYRGRFDNSTPGNDKAVTGKDLRDALDCILQREEINPHQHASVGCNIKWKK